MLSSVTIKCQINKDCHKSRFSIVSIVISVSNVTSPYDCSFRVFSNVFVFVNFLVMSCLLITLNKCLKGHKSLGSLCSVVKTLNRDRKTHVSWRHCHPESFCASGKFLRVAMESIIKKHAKMQRLLDGLETFRMIW